MSRDVQARGFRSSDVLCGIAASGRTPYVLGAIGEANRLGALTIGISCTPDSDLARSAKIAITPLTGPEIIAGSTRLKAGTATKMILNMLTTGSFIRLGYVRGNLMVNVQPKNSKLLDRSKRIVAKATGVSYEEAGRMLAEAGNNVRAAIDNWEKKKRIMDKFVIEGGRPLHGTIPTSGSKNSALPALAAALLTDEEVVLRRIPRVRDIRTMERLLVDIGSDIAVDEDDPEQVVLNTKTIVFARSPL